LERKEVAIFAALGWLEEDVEYEHCCVVFVIVFQGSALVDEGCDVNMSPGTIVCISPSKKSRDPPIRRECGTQILIYIS
jgi:hypothetical protein